MRTFNKFEYERKKGIIWVCDVEQSSKYLNSNESANDIEEYLPRLYWTSYNIVKSFNGKFIKWTGDGFLAWFEVSLDRCKKDIAKNVYEAAWHLSFLNNVTQLALTPKRKFKIRHGITYEKDALLLKIFEDDKKKSLDIIGRAVVLAFRLSSIKTDFPSIITEKEILPDSHSFLNFKQWNPTDIEIFKYFKGESLGTSDIFLSCKKENVNNRDLDDSRSSKIDIDNLIDGSSTTFIDDFLMLMSQGPDWCQKIIDLEVDFIKHDLIESIKNFNSLNIKD